MPRCSRSLPRSSGRPLANLTHNVRDSRSVAPSSRRRGPGLPPDRGPRVPGVRIGRPLRTRHTQGPPPGPRDRDRGEPRDHLGHQAPRVVGCGGAGRSADLLVVAVRVCDPAKVRLTLPAAGWISDAPSGLARGWRFRGVATSPLRPVRRSFRGPSSLAPFPGSRLVVRRRQLSHHKLQTGCNRCRPCSAGG